MGDNWWESFFSGLWLDVQRQSRTREQTQRETDFIEKVLQLKGKDRVLDVPCGEGRLSLELASRGYRMTGVDSCKALLEDARRKADKAGFDIVWEHRDMRDLPWKKEFDAAFCFWGSFAYFDDQGNTDFVRAVCRSLKPGGRFLLETEVAETLLPKFRGRDWQWIGDILVLEDRSFDCSAGRVDAEWTFLRGGLVEKRRSSIRIYTYRELSRIFEECGFSELETYGSLDQEPFKFGSKRLYPVARKSTRGNPR